MGGIVTPTDSKRSRCRAILIPCAMRLSRVGESAWLKAQQAGVQALYQRQLVRGKVYAVDGSGLGDDLRLVALVCVSATRPIIVAKKLLAKYGGLPGLVRADFAELCAEYGMGEAKIAQVKATLEIGRRLGLLQTGTWYKIRTPMDAANLVMLDLAYLDT